MLLGACCSSEARTVAKRSEKRATWLTNGHRFEMNVAGGVIQLYAADESTGTWGPLWGFSCLEDGA
jgi:hypothetical protein